MKSVFINDYNKTFDIYSSETFERLRKVTDIEPIIYSHNDVINSPQSFIDTEYIFSTWGMPVFTAEEIKECFPSLKCVFYAAGSVQDFSRPFLECGVRVFSAWMANAVPVAEYTVAQIILANKGFFQVSHLYGKGDYVKARETFESYKGNYGAKIGIIGAGMIGTLVIRMLKEYHLDVFVFDPFLSDSKAIELGVEKVSLERLFAECNVVSNHLANNAETIGMLNGKLFDKMLPYSTFLNTGRGAQVVESELIDTLKKRSDITAVLDVTFPEPIVADSELYRLENCVLTPHIAGSAGNEVHRMAEFITDEFYRYVNGEPCKYEVMIESLKIMA